MSDDSKNPFGEKTIVQSSGQNSRDDVPPSIGADKTMVFAKSNLQDTFDAKTVVRSSKPVPPATLPDQAPPRVIAVELPPPVHAEPEYKAEPKTEPKIELEIERPKLSKEERREARAELDRKTRKYMMALGAVIVLAVTVFVASLGTSGDKTATDAQTTANAHGVVPAPGQKSELASEGDSNQAKTAADSGRMLGAYKTTTDVLNDFDRASKKAQDHSVGF